MSLIICDTNVFISLFRNIEDTVDNLKLIGGDNVIIPSICVMELYRGMQTKVEMLGMQKKIDRYNILHINEDISEKAIDLIHRYKLSHNLDIPDAIIAATSLVYDISLFTYNTKDFKFIPGIKLYTPIA